MKKYKYTTDGTDVMCVCGHDKWEHAIGLKGDIGMCFKEIVEGWQYCDCKKFTPVNSDGKEKKENE